MSISKLGNLLDAYDKYGEYRVSTLKVTYIAIILFCTNVLFAPYNAVMFFIFIPIQALFVEVLLIDAKTKIMGTMIFCMLSLILMFIFNLTCPHPTLFILTVFICSLSVYHFVIHKYPYLIGFETLIIIIALLTAQHTINSNINILYNDTISAICGVTLMLSLLILFPRTFYYRLWLRALYFGTIDLKNALANPKLSDIKHERFRNVQRHLIKMDQFHKMLGLRKYSFSIIKINLCICRLCGYIVLFERMDTTNRQKRIENIVEILDNLIKHIEQERQFYYNVTQLISNSQDESNQCELAIRGLVDSWNSLCLKS